jgi:hypothetical protein
MNLAASIDFQALMEPVARHFFGDPNIALSKQGKELRWGARGSLSVNCEKGTWFNHETNAGGGVLDMIRSETGRDHANCIAWLQQQFVLNGASHGDPIKATIADRAANRRHLRYTDEFGALLYEVVRFEPKDFRQRRPDGLGGWIWNLDDTRRVLYRLPELIELRALDHPIFIVEGEKDVENLRALNIPATTNAGGAGKWRDEYSECFSGADVVVIPDNDDAGRNHAVQVAHSLTGIAARVRVLDLAVHWPGCPSKCDVSDLLDTGQTREQLDALIDRAPDATTWVKRRKLDGSGSTQPSSEKIAHWDDPDWSILDDRRGELPEFPINTLSPSCRE